MYILTPKLRSNKLTTVEGAGEGVGGWELMDPVESIKIMQDT